MHLFNLLQCLTWKMWYWYTQRKQFVVFQTSQKFLGFHFEWRECKVRCLQLQHKIIIFILALKNDIVKTLTWTTLLFTGYLIPLLWLIYFVYSAAVTQSVDSHWLFHSSLNHQPRSTKNCLHSANNSNKMNESTQSGLSVWWLCFNNLLNGFFSVFTSSHPLSVPVNM